MTTPEGDRYDVVADAAKTAEDVGFLNGEEPETCEECPACRIRQAIEAIKTPEDAARLGMTPLIAVSDVAEITARFIRERRD